MNSPFLLQLLPLPHEPRLEGDLVLLTLLLLLFLFLNLILKENQQMQGENSENLMLIHRQKCKSTLEKSKKYTHTWNKINTCASWRYTKTIISFLSHNNVCLCMNTHELMLCVYNGEERRVCVLYCTIKWYLWLSWILQSIWIVRLNSWSKCKLRRLTCSLIQTLIWYLWLCVRNVMKTLFAEAVN